MKALSALLPVFLFSSFLCMGEERVVKVYTLKDGTVVTADSTATIESGGITHYIVKPLADAQPRKTFDSTQLVKIDEKKMFVSGTERFIKTYTLKDGSTVTADHTSTAEAEGIRFYVVTPLTIEKRKVQFDGDQLVKVEDKTITVADVAPPKLEPAAAASNDAPAIAGRQNGQAGAANQNAQPPAPPQFPQAAPAIGSSAPRRNNVEPYTGVNLGVSSDNGYSNQNNGSYSNNYMGGGPYLQPPYLPYFPGPAILGANGLTTQNSPFYGGPNTTSNFGGRNTPTVPVIPSTGSRRLTNSTGSTNSMAGGCPSMSGSSGGSARSTAPSGPSSGSSGRNGK